MQKVSGEYKRSMKSSLRERAFIKISFGLINQEAQSKAIVRNGDFTNYSNLNLFDNVDSIVYATMEENFTKVDGTLLFLPRNQKDFYKNTGVISNNLISDSKCEVIIDLNDIGIDMKGLTINFGHNYPVDFDIFGDNNQKIEVRDNNTGSWYTESVLLNTTFIKLIFYRMKENKSRLRIKSIRFGYGLVYTNDSVLESSLNSYISPIGADIPQIDFTVKLKNYDKYFNVDNPESAINYLETGQEMDIMYGYELPNSKKIEWIQGGHLLCSSWESDDNTATIRCQDIFRNMDSEYNKGRFVKTGRSYYDLALEILKDGGINKYYIDPRLKKLYTNNPIPRVKHKEALQIIANACRCTLTQSRLGEVQIKSNFMPDIRVSSNSQEPYSNVTNITNNTIKDEYASLSKNYSNVKGNMFILPKNNNFIENVGYISKEISDDRGLFLTNPIIILEMEAIRSYSGFKIIFGGSVPNKIKIYAYCDEVKVNEYLISDDEIHTTTVFLKRIDDCNKIKLEFIQTKQPNNRIVVNNFILDDVSDFNMTQMDMLSFPVAIKQELVKEVIVPCYFYQSSNKEENLVYENVEVKNGQIETYYIHDASYGYSVRLDEREGLVDILEYGDYYIKLKFKTSGEYKLDVRGYRYKITEKLSIRSLNLKGKTIKWKNPLISNMQMADDLAEWLSDYYKSGIEYEYDTRGNPELDVNDIIYQENEFRSNMKVNIYDYVLGFNGSFSGRVIARRIGG